MKVFLYNVPFLPGCFESRAFVRPELQLSAVWLAAQIAELVAASLP